MASIECFVENGISYSLPYPESEDHHLRCPTLQQTGCFSKIQLVGQKYRDKTTLAS